MQETTNSWFSPTLIFLSLSLSLSPSLPVSLKINKLTLLRKGNINRNVLEKSVTNVEYNYKKAAPSPTEEREEQLENV